MSLVIKAASTSPVRIDLDIETDQGRIKGHFTGYAKIRSKGELRAFAERLQKLTEDDVQNADEIVLREMYVGFDGLANESGALTGDAAFTEILTGGLSVYLTRAATDAYWAQLSGAREGNGRPARGR